MTHNQVHQILRTSLVTSRRDRSQNVTNCKLWFVHLLPLTLASPWRGQKHSYTQPSQELTLSFMHQINVLSGRRRQQWRSLSLQTSNFVYIHQYYQLSLLSHRRWRARQLPFTSTSWRCYSLLPHNILIYSSNSHMWNRTDWSICHAIFTL